MRVQIGLGLALAALLGAVPAVAQESVAEAARKAREKRKATTQAKKSYTNDDVATVKGSPAAAVDTTSGATGTNAAAGTATTGQPEETPEQKWRKRFAEAREKLASAEKELAILERELGAGQVNYYPDPQKTLQEQTLRTDINDKRAKIDEKKREIATLRQSIEDLERQMRAEGGPPGWSRQ